MTLVGECGKDERWGRPRASPLPWVPARAGTTMGGVVGCVGARGWCQGGGPLSRAGGSRTAPTTGVGRTRAGVMRELLVAEGPLRAPSGQALTGSGRTDLGSARAVGSGGCDGGRRRPRAAPLPWVPVFTGTTMGGVVVGEGWWRRGGGPLSRAGDSRIAPTTGWWRRLGRDGGWGWGAATLLDSCLRWKSSGGRRRDGARG